MLHTVSFTRTSASDKLKGLLYVLLALSVCHSSALSADTSDSLEAISGTVDEHAHHRQMMAEKRGKFTRSEHKYTVPDVTLVTMHGARTLLAEQLDIDRPVLLNFIFTTCPTICPVLSATFSEVQEKLADDPVKPGMISITIDPEQDTPKVLLNYAERFRAGPNWQFLTGTLDDIVAVQKAFDAYRGNKMSHEPLTFLRAAPDKPWIRIDGFASAADITQAYRKITCK